MTPRWGEITAGTIITPIQGELISGSREAVISGLSTDSRKIAQAELFWALKGERYDGHDFLRQAIDKGAVGAVIQKGHRPEISATRNPVLISVTDTLRALGDLGNWWRREYPIPVAAITGSVGKTTTKEMAARILGLNALTLKNEGNLNNLIGLPLTLLLLEKEHRRAVLEMGMNRAGEIARLTEIAEPDMGLITNVGRAHLEGLGDINAVARAKVELLEKMPEKSQAILNGDDELLLSAASPFQRKVTTFGLRPENQIRAEKIQSLGKEGTVFDLRFFGQTQGVRLRVPGLQNVFNALAASALAFGLEASAEHIREGLEAFEGIKGRFMISHLADGIILVDDTYNCNPASLKAALDSAKALVTGEGRLIVGLGEMLELGDETVPAHLEAGNMVAERGAFYFLAMGEHAPQMIEGAVSKGFPKERAAEARSHEEMAKEIGASMNKGDVILLKGSRRMQLEIVAGYLKGKDQEEY
ncbi:MAG: UDP-N-acetylmuramoyl-tripeptide--D-alanyl-D-alanine ligase [Desulfobacteraceae bacterium]|jgi:UDP-N-acetylmuramoyl-tripeptide--D-alanyl-D-alanine ligase